MDTLTHTLTGIVMSRAGLKRWSPYATPLLLLAANAPDIDMVTLFGGTTNCLHYHRHIAHSLIAAPFLALLPVLVVRLFARKPFGWKAAYGISVLGVLSHLLLDWTNSYGIRLLLPFSGVWVHLDIFDIVDVWIWAILLAAVFVPLLAALVSREIGARPGSGRAIAATALCFLALYGFGRYLLHNRASAILESRLYSGLAPLRVAAFPTGTNPLRWRGLVETGPFYSIEDVNLLTGFDPAAGQLYYKPEPNPVEAAAADAARCVSR
jgi:inner membrane protein